MFPTLLLPPNRGRVGNRVYYYYIESIRERVLAFFLKIFFRTFSEFWVTARDPENTRSEHTFITLLHTGALKRV